MQKNGNYCRQYEGRALRLGFWITAPYSVSGFGAELTEILSKVQHSALQTREDNVVLTM